MPNPIRWGILSTARISRQFAGDFSHAKGGELLAVASRRMDRAQAFASEFGIPRAYGSYEEMLADPDIDAVYVSTPHTLHLSNSMQAIAAGKAVLCEKPLTVAPGEAEELFAAAEQAGVYLMEAMWTWFLPAVQTALEWHDSGRIGKLLHVKADFGFPMPFDPASRVYARELAGGCLLDMGIYPIALAWLFTRSDPLSIQVQHHLAPNGADDDVLMHFDLGECQAALSTSFRARLPNSAWLIGDEGTIGIPDFWRARECTLYRRDEVLDHFSDDRRGRGFEFEIAAVNRDLQAGRKRPGVVTWKDSRAFQRHMAAVFKKMGRQPVL
ncbi:MAG: Gfo/Idh/MocA family oxidoreductase [Lysobacterales bacterium]|jgi:predicted dehydrogenase